MRVLEYDRVLGRGGIEVHGTADAGVAVSGPIDGAAVAAKVDGQGAGAAGEAAVPPTEPPVGAGDLVPELVGVGGGAVALEDAAVEDQRALAGQADVDVGLDDAVVEPRPTVIGVGAGKDDRARAGFRHPAAAAAADYPGVIADVAAVLLEAEIAGGKGEGDAVRGRAGKVERARAALGDCTRRVTHRVERSAAVDRPGNGRVAVAIESQRTDNCMQIPADHQRLSAVDRPGLRSADGDRDVERGALMDRHASARDRQATVVGPAKDIARGTGTDRHAMGDDRSANRDIRITRGVEGCRGLAVVPGVGRERISVHIGAGPTVSAEGPYARAAIPGDRSHGTAEIHLAVNAGHVIVVNPEAMTSLSSQARRRRQSRRTRCGFHRRSTSIPNCS